MGTASALIVSRVVSSTLKSIIRLSP